MPLVSEGARVTACARVLSLPSPPASLQPPFRWTDTDTKSDYQLICNHSHVYQRTCHPHSCCCCTITREREGEEVDKTGAESEV